ncbi:EAL domain-containing protein [uncultured Cedecea sp.]|uniref:EAL domain-containing protein n=1 Tax=uncultured Cedecea sp. TaxID=988762 RepID=UPI00260B9341|nr:EAL domain-containing protein [uncultured Cedecea sp.]
MQTAQRVISDYRRRRLIVCILFTTLVFVLTLTIKFITERQLNEQRLLHFSERAVSTVETLLAPFDMLFQDALPLMVLPCENVQRTLREHTARVPTVRSISLVKNGIIYCSSVFGSTDYNIQTMHPRLPTPTPLLLLSIDRLINKGSPILISWRPVPTHSNDGVIQVINLSMLAGFIQYTDVPWIDKTILNIADSHFEYTHGIVNTIEVSADQVRQDIFSEHYPFSITTVGPSATILALNNLPSQLPLAIVLSLLAGTCAWFMTAKRMSFFHEIHMGLAAREFEVYCQPLIHADSGECVGIELLLRWHNPRQGNISPDGFIPLAEQLNLIVPLTCFVLRETVKYLDQLPKMNGFHISLNVAARHFKNGAIIEDLSRYWFPAHPQQILILELTERDALPQVSHQVVRDLHHSGVRLAIDDFGTGHSSLAYLETLSPDILKIDKSFTAAIGTDAVNSKVTDMIIALGHRLNIELIAEGVETPEQADFLRKQGVSLLQGYLYAKPMPLTQFPYWLENHDMVISRQKTADIT